MKKTSLLTNLVTASHVIRTALVGSLQMLKQISLKCLQLTQKVPRTKWNFSSNASATSAAWRAFHDHKEVNRGESVGILAWNPEVLNGSEPKDDQRAFMYREQNGVKSVLLDDDYCDCHSTLSLGHGMCLSNHNPVYSDVNSFGVDALYDPGCHGPRSGIGLTLYVRRKTPN